MKSLRSTEKFLTIFFTHTTLTFKALQWIRHLHINRKSWVVYQTVSFSTTFSDP